MASGAWLRLSPMLRKGPFISIKACECANVSQAFAHRGLLREASSGLFFFHSCTLGDDGLASLPPNANSEALKPELEIVILRFDLM